jgi:CP family cyanate transporter-like MFS transporter
MAIGGAVAVGNVVVPSLINRDFPSRRGLMTGLYSVALFIGGGLSAGLTVPLEHLTGLGWRGTIGLWALIAVLGLMIWVPRTRAERGPGKATSGTLSHVEGLWRDRVAWCVTLFMGLQALGYYAAVSWLPTILEDHGVSSGTAGWLLSYSTLPGMLAALATPWLERRVLGPSQLVVLSALLTGGGYAGLLASPASATYVWMTVLGLGQGMTLSLALGYIIARAPDGNHAAHLSTMAQSIGYMLAAVGPLLVGALHGETGSWMLPLLLLSALLLPLTLTGLVASRPRYVLEGKVHGPAMAKSLTVEYGCPPRPSAPAATLPFTRVSVATLPFTRVRIGVLHPWAAKSTPNDVPAGGAARGGGARFGPIARSGGGAFASGAAEV